MHEPTQYEPHHGGGDGPGWFGVLVGGAAGILAGLVIALALGIGSSTTTKTVTSRAATPPANVDPGGTVVTVTAVPDVIGLRLDIAKQRIRRSGFDVSVKGGGLLGVVVEQNWRVVAQDPPGGNKREQGSSVTLDIDRN